MRQAMFFYAIFLGSGQWAPYDAVRKESRSEGFLIE